MAPESSRSNDWVNSLRAAVAAYQQTREVSEAFVRLTLRDGTDMYVQGLQGGPLDGWISIAEYPVRAVESVKASIPSRLASVATSATSASETARSSSNSTRTPSSPTGPSSCTIKVTS